MTDDIRLILIKFLFQNILYDHNRSILVNIDDDLKFLFIDDIKVQKANIKHNNDL